MMAPVPPRYSGVAAASAAGSASLNGPRFYGLPANEDTITLERRPWTVPERLAAGSGELVPFAAGEDVAWRIVGD